MWKIWANPLWPKASISFQKSYKSPNLVTLVPGQRSFRPVSVECSHPRFAEPDPTQKMVIF